jgi:hypothetical protein
MEGEIMTVIYKRFGKETENKTGCSRELVKTECG